MIGKRIKTNTVVSAHPLLETINTSIDIVTPDFKIGQDVSFVQRSCVLPGIIVAIYISGNILIDCRDPKKSSNCNSELYITYEVEEIEKYGAGPISRPFNIYTSYLDAYKNISNSDLDILRSAKPRRDVWQQTE